MFLDRDQQIGLGTVRVKQILVDADTVAWSNPNFPVGHRPDVPTLQKNIMVGYEAPSAYKLHPQLRPNVRQQLEESLASFDTVFYRTKAAWCDSEKRKIVLYPPTLSMPEWELKRLVYHEAATDTHERIKVTRPSNYSPEQKSQVLYDIKEGFPKKSGVSIKDTRIVKAGFREMLYCDQYFITDLLSIPEELESIGEVYPTAMELITSEIIQRNGDIQDFDNDAKNGKLQIAKGEPQPHFSAALYQSIQQVDWRAVLTAFNMGSIKSTAMHFIKHAPENGLQIFRDLVEAMNKDEQAISSRA